MRKVPVNIKKLKANAALPVYSSAAAAGADLRACLEEDVIIRPGKTEMISTGLAMEVPEGLSLIHICLLSTAADLFEMGVRPLVLTEYSGSHDGPKYHDAGIVAMEHLIGPNFLIEKNDRCV